MSVFARCRVSLLLLLGLAGAALLGGVPLTRCGAEESAGPVSIVTGRVLGLAKGQDARVEVRRLGAQVDLLADLPICGEADSCGRVLWLTSGAAVGEALQVVLVEGPGATYRIEGLRAGTYELALVRDGQVVWRTPAALEIDGQQVEADLSVPTGSLLLRARLRWADGRPFRGLVVVEQAERGLKARPYLAGAREVEADETGLIEIGSLHRGSCELTAFVPGHLRIRREPVILPQQGILDWTLDEGASVAGTVVRRSDGQPVAGAEVRAHGRGVGRGAFIMSRTETDERGRFRIPRGDRTTEFSIVAEGLAPAWIKLGASEALGSVTLDDLATVEGFVRGGDGTPLPDVLVRAEPRWSFGVPRAASEVRTTEQGRYRFEVPPGETRILVHDEHWISPRSDEGDELWFDPLAFQVPPGETRRLDLVAAPAARLQGRLVDGEGVAISGALLRYGEPDRLAVTGADGSFELSGVPGRDGSLWVQRPGFLDATFDHVRPSADGKPVSLRLEAGLRFDVRVFTGDGAAPVVRARVRASHTTVIEKTGDRNAPTRFGPGDTYLRASTWSRVEERSYAPDAWTDADGRARVGPIAGGRNELTVEAAGFVSVTRTIEVGSGTTVDVRLQPTASRTAPSIQGRIGIPAGVGIEEIDVRRTGPDELLLGSWGKEGGTLVALEPGGEFRIPDLEKGRYGLRAVAWAAGRAYFAETSAAAGDTDVELRLVPAPWITKPPDAIAPRRTWSFRIVGPGGEPVAGGMATAQIQGAQHVANRRWRFRAGRLEAAAEPGDGDAVFWFYGAQDDCGVWLPFGFARVGPVKAGGPPVDVILPAEQTLRGVVLGPDGRGVRGVRVLARPAEIDSTWSHGQTALTRGDGRFTLGGLGAGPACLVSTEVPRWAARLPPVRVAADLYEWDTLTIRLHEAVAPRILVLDPGGSPLANAETRIEPDGDDFSTFDDNVVLESFYSGPGWVIERTDEKGLVAFTRLDPDRGYVLRIDPPASRSDLAPFYDRAWRPRAEQAIRLLPWASLRGAVRDRKGATVEGAVIWVKEPWLDEWEERATTDAGGGFSLERLLPGAVSLLATRPGTSPDDEASAGGSLHTTTDAGPVVLLLPR